jgi:hypothetical protein
MSEIILPTKKTAPTAVSPENLMIFSKPKVGKTSLLAALDDCLLLDLESGSKYIEAMRMEATDIAGIKAIGEAIKAQNNPYKYVAIDTVTKLEDLCIPYAEQLYSKSPMGKNWFKEGDGGKAKYGTIIGMPDGAGYYWLRLAFTKVTDYISTWAPTTIFLGHVKDVMLEKDGANFSAMDIDLTGKLKRITAAHVDAIGYLYRKGSKKNILSFKTAGDVTCGARPEHLKNKEIVISELDDNGKVITHWDQIFID